MGIYCELLTYCTIRSTAASMYSWLQLTPLLVTTLRMSAGSCSAVGQVNSYTTGMIVLRAIKAVAISR